MLKWLSSNKTNKKGAKMNNLDFLKGGGANPYRVEVIDNNALVQGDCLEVMQWLIDNNVKVDAIITDPPYG